MVRGQKKNPKEDEEGKKRQGKWDQKKWHRFKKSSNRGTINRLALAINERSKKNTESGKIKKKRVRWRGKRAKAGFRGALRLLRGKIKGFGGGRKAKVSSWGCYTRHRILFKGIVHAGGGGLG